MTADDPADEWFGERVAARYDDGHGIEYDPDEIARTVDLLAELAGDGPALEFAIGTGRIGSPLAARGISVHGIEISRSMVARIDGKPGSERIAVTIGDMATTRVAGEFTLVYLVFNTINNVTTQDGQVAVFANAAAHLGPGGRVVVEVGVPALRRLPRGQDTVPFRYVWPSELDLMARLAGLSLEHRWADWDRAPFTADSTQHVSVWRKDDA